MKRLLAVGAASVTAALLVGGCGGSGRVTSLLGLTKSKLAELEATVRTESATLGDAHPSGVMVFATEWHKAAAAAGIDLGSSRPVYLVVVRGHFSCAGCAGSAPATADVMTLVLDRKTLLARSGSSFGASVDTGNLGPGMPLVIHPYVYHP
jgi:hypothetical protein